MDISDSKKYKTPQKHLKCYVCGASPCVGRADLKVSWFRGDDERIFLCEEHWKVRHKRGAMTRSNGEG